MNKITDERLAILERFGDSDTQDLCAEIKRLREELRVLIEGEHP